ncbi:MAG: hypothetical protein ACTSWC_08775 [Promethearchaeota archaeon]
MPQNIARKITNYFDIIAARDVPIDLFNNPFIQRCSKFRIKNLPHGAQKKITTHLIKTERIFPFYLNSEDNFQINSNHGSDDKFTHNQDFLLSILTITEKTFTTYYAQGYTDYKPSHEEILSTILLQHDGALSIEVPVWTRKKSSLEQFLVKIDSSNKLSCDFSYSLTGHIDLLLWDTETECLIIADYKPEGYFLRSLPQVATYGLMLEKILELPRILCLSFNKESAWLYSPHILIEDINPLLSQYGDPPLNWRKIAKGFERFYKRGKKF